VSQGERVERARDDRRERDGLVRSGAEFERRLNALLTTASGIAVLLVLAYLRFGAELDRSQWSALARVCAGAFPALLASNLLYNRFYFRPIVRWLDTPSADAAAPAYAALVRLPRYLWLQGAFTWLGGSALVALVSRAVDTSIDASTAWAIAISGTCGGFVSVSFLYFRVKERHRALVARAGAECDARTGDGLRRVAIAVSLRAKLLTSSGGVALAATGFAVWLALDAAADDREARALALLENVVAAQRELASESSDASSLAQMRSHARALGIADELIELGVGSDALSPEQAALIEPLELDRPAAAASGARRAGGALFAWQRVGAGDAARTLIAISTSAHHRDGTAVLGAGKLALLVAIVAALTIGLAQMLARDIATSVDGLRSMAEAVSSGSLADDQRVDAEDELGVLSRDFRAMTGVLRRAVGSVRAAVDALESQASLLASDAMHVAASAGEQRRGVAGVSAALEAVRNQAAEIEASGSDLRRAVDDAASAIAQLGASSHAVEGMAGAFGERIDVASSSVEQLVRSARSVGVSTRGLSEAASETARAMRDMSGSLREVERAAVRGSQLAGEAVGAADRGRASVREVQSDMQSILAATTDAKVVIERLADRAAEIGSILDVIDDVADETNLLALNAAIIAAQSGEQGRAFSVVADEIKALADRVLSSTKEIGAVVRAVQSESASAALAIGESARRVDAGLDRSGEAARALDAIEGASRETGRHIDTIAQAVRAQAEASAGVVASMDRVREGSESIDRAMEEQNRTNGLVLEAATGIRELSHQLARTTSEQAIGATSIGRSVEGVRSAVEEIESAVRGQISACAEVVASIDAVASGTAAHDEAAQRIGAATNELREYANELRREVARFRLDA